MKNETETQTRLRRAKEALRVAQDSENEALKALAAAVESTKRARAKHESLFIEEENAELRRRRADYLHTTK